MKIIDTHAHYDDKAFDDDRDELISSLPSHGVIYAVNVGASFAGARDSVRLAEKYPHIYAACGIHPDDTGYLEALLPAEAISEALSQIRSLASHPKCVAIGEIGLDYHWMVQPKEVQKRWFIAQLELALEMGKPINVHSRDAAQDTFDIVRDYHYRGFAQSGIGQRERPDSCRHPDSQSDFHRQFDCPGIIHCFSGSPEMAREYVRMGYYLGIGGVVTYKNGRVLKEVVRAVPIEYLVTETDCPYLAPTGHRGQRNDSTYLPLVVETIAQLKEMDTEEAAAVLYENACNVYGLPR